VGEALVNASVPSGFRQEGKLLGVYWNVGVQKEICCIVLGTMLGQGMS